ncbi:hypothetical protein M6B38_258985 [Iris pallida]|uniref:Uncharacterized protein n=1 Tax=Iris pallida TaxID=29817 RepID=A0AAX6IDY7_IRIPA|nr:hypothetical protein M6B38_246585 [Iris pallida]KAJ6851432.1 hypothetical protein M6B38_258985 [Iris pallida]
MGLAIYNKIIWVFSKSGRWHISNKSRSGGLKLSL